MFVTPHEYENAHIFFSDVFVFNNGRDYVIDNVSESSRHLSVKHIGTVQVAELACALYLWTLLARTGKTSMSSDLFFVCAKGYYSEPLGTKQHCIPGLFSFLNEKKLKVFSICNELIHITSAPRTASLTPWGYAVATYFEEHYCLPPYTASVDNKLYVPALFTSSGASTLAVASASIIPSKLATFGNVSWKVQVVFVFVELSNWSHL